MKFSQPILVGFALWVSLMLVAQWMRTASRPSDVEPESQLVCEHGLWVAPLYIPVANPHSLE